MKQERIPLGSWQEGHTSISSLMLQKLHLHLRGQAVSLCSVAGSVSPPVTQRCPQQPGPAINPVLLDHPGIPDVWETQRVTGWKLSRAIMAVSKLLFQGVSLPPFPRSSPRSRAATYHCHNNADDQDLAAVYQCFTSYTIPRISLGWRWCS